MNSNRKYGIGGSTAAIELEKITEPENKPKPIEALEFRSRIEKACKTLKNEGIDALYLNAGTNLYYFTGTKWPASERLVGAIFLANGSLYYFIPEFETGTFKEYMVLEGELIPWQEHECPVQKIFDLLDNQSMLAIDDSTPYNLVSRFQEDEHLKVVSAEKLIRNIRMFKTDAEIGQIQYAMNLTMDVHKAAARILRPGILPSEVCHFINQAHKKLGISTGSYFCIVLFGKDSSFPHGVRNPKALEEGDMVLIDTGCQYHGYISDITRTYIYGTASEEQSRIWSIEKACQLAAFNASQVGSTCGSIDEEVRQTLVNYKLGPGYNVPGLPHRTGHGIGLEIHENPYILGGNETLLKPGMTYSIEPMIVVPDKFGVRLEDHVYITEDGPKWFTNPAESIENPFGVM